MRRTHPTGALVRLVVGAFFVCVAALAHAGRPVLVDPGIPSGERSVYRLTKRDGSRSTSIHFITVESTEDGPVYVIQTESKRMVLRKENLTPISITQRRRDGSVDWKILYSKDRVNFIYPGPKRNKVQKVGENRYDVNPIVHIVRGFPFGKTKKVKFDLVVPDRVLGVALEIEGEERVTVPLGTFDTYRIRIGLTGIKGRVYTKKIRFWVEKASPHRLIRQEDEGITDTRLTELVEYRVEGTGAAR